MSRVWDFDLDDALPWDPHPLYSAAAIASAAFEGSAFVVHVRIEDNGASAPILITLTVDDRMTDDDRRRVNRSVRDVLPPYVCVDWAEVKATRP